MSCSASSNIQGSNVTQNPNGPASRLVLNLESSSDFYDLDAGITNGDAIRFQPTPLGTTGTYRRSQANNNENSEVVGVVESIDTVTGNLTVVLRGIMNHPQSNFEYNEDVYGMTSGASGGNDIFFLSNGVSGGFMNLAPSEPGTIAKPILQRMSDSTGSYNYQVLNYIGYQIGGDMIAETQSTLPIGSFMKIPESSITPNGWENATSTTNPTDLDVALYPDYYSFAGLRFGFIQTLRLLGIQVTSSMINLTITQKRPNGDIYTSGKIKSGSGGIANVEMSPLAIEFLQDETFPVIITSVAGTITGTVQTASIKSVMVPRIIDNSSIAFNSLGATVTPSFKTIIKVRDVVGVSIPKNVTVNDLNALTTLALGNTYSNVSSTLDDIISRIVILETAINGAS